MIMGVSVGAYSAGLFHLMTHAFFKALLFMGAGSLIGAMGGNQSLDRMSGFRRALPFTFACFIIGGLALSAVPPFSGFFSKDDILAQIGSRGGWYWALYVAGYLGALLTSLYTFRMIFRAFLGDPCPEASELIEHGHLFHPAQPTNPANGEVEDTEVGFPGPDHVIAERARAMQLAMGLLALLAVLGGVVGIPKTTTWLEKFLAPTFANSTLHLNPSNTLVYVGLVLGTVIGLLGIAIAWFVWVARPGLAPAVAKRLRFLDRLFENKWYFDELIDAVVVRPAAWFGRFAQGTFERLFVNGTLIGGTTAVVRAGSAAVRSAESGFVRYYAALLVVGLTAVGLYFLIQS
jgi:NADH-quinone oxidoreductase subunit L